MFLTDFRKGRLGKIALEAPPKLEDIVAAAAAAEQGDQGEKVTKPDIRFIQDVEFGNRLATGDFDGW